MSFRSAICSLALVLLPLITSCKDPDKGRLLFEHDLHLKQVEMACLDCHGPVENGRYRRPDHDSCDQCHREIIDTQELSRKTCGTCHDVENPEKIGEGKASLRVKGSKGVFIHTQDSAQTCEECHSELLAQPDRKGYSLSDKEVLRLRDKSHKTARPCRACHENLNRETPPPTHRGNWKRGHGAPGTEDGAACSICHRQNSCRECHQSERPTSHNGQWTEKHGKVAADPKSCRTCHTPDSCQSCHRETRPRSHNGQWTQRHGLSAADPKSCRTCHTPDSCQACHRETRPRSHNGQWTQRHGLSAADPRSCRTCHTPDSCQSCHRETRPRSHNAQWTRIHGSAAAGNQVSCQSCHTPASCQSCHQTQRPVSHTASWKDRHCLACHPSQGPGSGCLACHKEGLARHRTVRIEHKPKREPCLTCHGPVSGVPGKRLNPKRHPIFSSDACLGCHRY